MSKNNYKNLYDNDIVLELTFKDFIVVKKQLKLKNTISNNKKGIILFYTSWCKHCHHMVEDWVELANYFKNRFLFAAVNCENLIDNNDECCVLAHIKRYPTLKYITKKGNINNYIGNITKTDIAYFIYSKE